MPDLDRRCLSRHRLSTHPLFVTVVVITLFNTGWFAIGLSEQAGHRAFSGLPGLISMVLASLALRSACRSPGLAREARRFWGMLGLAAGLVATSTALQAVMDLTGTFPAGEAMSAVFSLAASPVVLWGMFRLPLNVASRSEMTRLGLDIAIVIIAALLFVWYFLVGPALGHLPTGRDLKGGLFLVTAAVCALAVVKVILAGSQTIDPVALRLLGAALLIDVAGIAAQPLLEGQQHRDSFQLSSCLIAVFVVAAGLRQRLAAASGRAPRAMITRRTFSMLPYVAVAAVSALSLFSLQRDGRNASLVAAGAVLLTAMVMARQLMAFRDNARLIDQLASQERRFRSLVQSASDVIAVLDAAGRTTYVSPGGERLTGLPAQELLGREGWFTAEPASPSARARWARLVAEPGATVTYQTRLRHTDGSWRWLEVTHTNLLGDTAVDGVVTNLRDVTESYAYQQQLSHQASHDSLTELANRSLFGEQLQRAIARSARSGLSLALIDLDDFKAVNDTLGHQAGDSLLIAVAERLRLSVRPSDLVARLGGDEFAVLLEDIPRSAVGAAAERILSALTEPIAVHDQDLLVQASIGIADAGPDDDASGLLRHADIAMYEAKAAGKGRYCRYTEAMTALATPRARQAVELRQALHEQRLELHYQPIVTLPDANIVGVEALVRCRHPERGLVPPGDFIPLAEQTGLIIPIGQWVLREACRQAVDWLGNSATADLGSVSVNISARHLRDPSVVDHVADTLRETGLTAGRLTLEFTETAVLSQSSALDAARALRALGVRIALDDFGTGHSTLSLLQSCPVDALKLDRSFLPSQQSAAIAAAVAQVADALDLDVVAEGVETAAQADALYTLGYRRAQGFHFGRPAPASAYSMANHNADMATP
jgi:diguanylate cyclase (GGDEF)-like protein/PAS domain S-box-containing protein